MLLMVPAPVPYPSSPPGSEGIAEMPREPQGHVRVQRAVLQSLRVLSEVGPEGHPHVWRKVWRRRTAPDEQGRGGKGEESHERK